MLLQEVSGSMLAVHMHERTPRTEMPCRQLHLQLICQDPSCESGTIVATPAHQHDALQAQR